MPYSGYPTPDKPPVVELVCHKIYLPNSPTLLAILLGQMVEMTKPSYWSETGDWDITDLTEWMYRAVVATPEDEGESECVDMSCEIVADCIETDPDVLAALLQQLGANGFTQNQNSSSSPTVLPTAKQAETLLPADFDCSTPAHNMAVARSIVRELHETIEDLFEIIEYITNPVELTAEVTDSVPVLSAASDAASVADWIQENIQESYEAAYTQSAEDTIACAIFCYLQTTCDVSLTDLIDIYLGIDAGITPPSDPNDINALCDYILGLSLALPTTGIVAVFHLIILYLMRFGGDVVTMLGFNSIKTAIASASALMDTSYETACDDCPVTETPTSYWYLPYDFNMGQQGWVAGAGTTIWENSGWNGRTVTSNTQASANKATFGGLTYYLAKVRSTSLRRGSQNSGTFDFKRLNIYPAINFGGTVQQAWNSNFITPLEDSNSTVRISATLADNSFPFQSAVIVEGVAGTYVNPDNQCKIWKVELWGYNHSNQKPLGAIWVNALP